MSKCRICDEHLKHVVTDLGMSPLANSYLKEDNLNKAELFLPLKVHVCEKCYLVQLESYEKPENIFTNYAYFSSVSSSWLKHCKEYSDKMIEKLHLTEESLVVEIASNDGYLLKNFVEKSIPVIGVEPAANVAEVAKEKGVNTVVAFFGENLAKKLNNQGKKANLRVANNVLAHVPDIVDFAKGLKVLSEEYGVITIEFPHLLNLLKSNQYDTIYHEHYSYLSLITVQYLFKEVGLTIFDIEELTTHGGSLRIYLKHESNEKIAIKESVNELISLEMKEGLKDIHTYLDFAEKVKANKREALNKLSELKKLGHSIVGYGAPAKGNTFLNYCGIRDDFLDYTVDKSIHKQGLFLPGTHLKIEHPNKLIETKPNYILILPWNLKEEIKEELNQINTWGAKYIIAIPNVEVIS